MGIRDEVSMPAAIELVLTLVPTSTSLHDYAVAGTLVVAPRETLG